MQKRMGMEKIYDAKMFSKECEKVYESKLIYEWQKIYHCKKKCKNVKKYANAKRYAHDKKYKNVRKYTIVKKHSVSLGTDPPLVNHNLAIFSVHSGTEKLNKSPQADKKPW